MDPAFIALAGTLLGAPLLMLLQYMLKPKPKAIDWHYIRELEAEAGMELSPLACGPKCKKCRAEKNKPRSVKDLRPPVGPGYAPKAVTRGFPDCSSCGDVRVQKEGNTCQPCTQNILAERRKYREAQAKAKAYRPPERRVKEIQGKDIQIPDDVPEYASFTVSYDPMYMADLIYFKWTDPSTGYTMGRKMYVPDLEKMKL